jgi:hypothetical protein
VAILTADIIALALQYGCYGYRLITALRRDAGRRVNQNHGSFVGLALSFILIKSVHTA